MTRTTKIKELAIEHERIAWELRQQCWTQERIAARLGISQSAVSQILRKLRHRYLKKNEKELEAIKNEQVAQLEYMADELFQSWERSKYTKPDESDEQKIGVGDPKLLTAAMKAKEDIRKILGADAPIKTESTGKIDHSVEAKVTIYIPDNVRDSKENITISDK